jgi:hypothetical protein
VFIVGRVTIEMRDPHGSLAADGVGAGVGVGAGTVCALAEAAALTMAHENEATVTNRASFVIIRRIIAGSAGVLEEAFRIIRSADGAGRGGVLRYGHAT